MSENPSVDSMAVTRRMYAKDMRTTDERLAGIESRQDALEKGLQANTEATHQIAASTTELLDLMNGFKVGFKALNVVAKVIAPLVTICTAIAAFIVFLKGGVRP